jgi:hypothetical protein
MSTASVGRGVASVKDLAIEMDTREMARRLYL